MFGIFKKSKKKLVLTLTYTIQWIDLNDRIETMYFYLFEDDKGRRSYKVHEYGQCALEEKHKKYLGEILRWVHGSDTQTLLKNWSGKSEVPPIIPPNPPRKPKLELVKS